MCRASGSTVGVAYGLSSDLLLAAAGTGKSTALRAAEITGVLILPTILILGIVKCASIARRPTTSAWCVHALAMALGAHLILTVAHVAEQLLGVSARWFWVQIVTTLLGFSSMLAAAAVAAIGLVNYRRRPELVQGRRQAIAASACVC